MSYLSTNDIARAIHLSHQEGTSTRKIVEFLARRRLLSKSTQIFREVEKIMDGEKGKVRALVKSAKKLPGKTKSEIEHTLTKRYNAKEIVLKEEISPELLGGFRIEAKDEIIDLTLRHKINELKKYLIR